MSTTSDLVAALKKELKAAQMTYADLALELGKYGITVNYLLPGAIHTGMTAASFQDEKIRAVWAKKAALRRLGQPIDMARSVLLLASDEADFITGHGLVADGGLTLRT